MPEVLSIYIQKVNPMWFSGPTVSQKRFTSWIFHPYTCKIWLKFSGGSLSVLVVNLFLFISSSQIKDRINCVSFNMRICNYYKSPIRGVYLYIHFFVRLLRKLFFIKFEVFGIVSIVNVKPEHIHLKLVSSKQVVSLNHGLCINRSPLAEMKSQAISRWHIRVSRDVG